MSTEQITIAIEANRVAYKRAEKRLSTLRQEGHRLEAELRRAQLAEHVGGEVVTRYRGQYPRRDGQVGTLVAVRRTRAVVKWNDDGEWTIPVSDIMPSVDANQRGLYLAATGGSK